MTRTEEQADKMKKLTAAILEVASASDGANDPLVVAGSLGVVAGLVAKSTESPEMTLQVIIKIANGVLSGDLMKSFEIIP